jgi:tetratricopeptide (TPR) repeat protein
MAASLAERRFEASRAALAARVGRPEAAASLAVLLNLAEDLSPDRIMALVQTLASDRRTDPLVAAQAEHQLARDAAAHGDDTQAHRRWGDLGLWGERPDTLSIVGPFDAAGRGGLDRTFPPELAGGGPTAAPRTFPGKEREVSWRVAPADARAGGALALDALLRPDRDAVAYVLTYVRSDRARAAVLRLGSPGPTKIWVGGQEVSSRNVAREARFDQDAAAITLPVGETAILIKTVLLEGSWRLFVRLTDSAGRPLTGVTRAARSSKPWLPAGAVAGAKTSGGSAVRELGTLLQARAEGGGGKQDDGKQDDAKNGDKAKAAAADAWLDLGQWLGFSRQADREAKLEEAALDRATGPEASTETRIDAWLQLGARAQEDEDRRVAYEKAAAGARDPGRQAVALVGLGELAQARRRDSEAIARFRAAAAADPGNVDAAIALGGQEENAGLPAAALARLQDLAPAARQIRRVRLARIRLYDVLGRHGDADRERGELFVDHRNDLDLALSLARSARDRGDLESAISLHEAAAHHHPALPFVVGEWARLLEGSGHRAEARKQLELVTVRLPDDPGGWEDLGRFLVRTGDLEDAVAPLRRALALRPQNPPLRRYLARLEGELQGQTTDPGDELVRSFAEDGEALARPALLDPPRDRGRGGTDVLLDKKVVRVHRNGLAERYVQRLVLVRTEQAVKEAIEQGIRYTPGSQEVEVRRARIYRRNPTAAPGAPDSVEVLEAAGRDDRDLSEPWYGLYYDVRAEVVLYEGLRPGDVLELSYTLADVSYENVLRDYFGDLDLIAETAPRRRWEYILLGPAERKFYVNEPKLPRYAHTEEKRGDEILHRFVATDVARVVSEPGMPGWAEVAPYLHISTYAGWDDVGRWYWGLVSDQLAADANLRKAAKGAVAGATSLLDKVRGLHRLVLESTRYVGLEFGIHGYKPYKVTQIMARRFGDCKDKASLLHVLLRESGIESEIVLLRTRRSGKVASFPASLAVFDHAIVYVPALQLYLDGTAEFSGMEELPSEDQGVTVLRVGPKGATLAETPVFAASKNAVVRRWTATLDPTGSARIEEEISVRGQAAPEWREHYETPGERSERYARVWESRFPGAKLESVTIEGVEDRNLPVVARSVAQVPVLGEEAGADALRLPVAAREPDFVRSYGRLSARRQDYLLGYPFHHEEQLSFVLPPGWQVATLPAGRHLESRFGTFSLEVTQTEAQGHREIHVASRTEITQYRVGPADYPAFRAFLGQLDAALRQSIVVRKGAAP